MKVTTVSAGVRYSKRLDDGSHKTVELSAEAELDGRDGWQDAQAKLYADLGQQLKALWNGKANGNVQATKGSEKPETTPEHYCEMHGVPFKRHEKDGKAWYSHKLDSRKWCNEK